MNENFKPQYRYKTHLIPIIMILFVTAMAIHISVIEPNFETYSSLIFLISLIVFIFLFPLLFVFYKSIQFTNIIQINRYIFPTIEINYDEIKGYTNYAIITSKGKIRYNMMENEDEFIKILKSKYYTYMQIKKFPKGPYFLKDEFGYKILRITFILIPINITILFYSNLNIPGIIIIILSSLPWGLFSFILYKIYVNQFIQKKEIPAAKLVATLILITLPLYSIIFSVMFKNLKLSILINGILNFFK